jgi:hypothetical protein
MTSPSKNQTWTVESEKALLLSVLDSVPDVKPNWKLVEDSLLKLDLGTTVSLNHAASSD